MIEKFVGIPFKNLGRDRKGLDCWGLVLLYHKEILGNYLPDYLIDCLNSTKIDSQVYEGLASSNWESVKIPINGDIVLMRSNIGKNQNLISHVGVFIGEGKFIHALEKTCSMVSKVDGKLWGSRISGFIRWRK